MILRRGIYAQKRVGSPAPSTVLIPGDGTTNWTNVIGDLTTSLGAIERTTTSVAWGNMGAFASIPANTDGFVEFKLFNKFGLTTGIMMGGLSLTPSGTNYADIDYKFYYEGQYLRMSVFNGGRVNTTTGITIATDVWKVERTIVGGVGTVKFYRNGILFYTHPTTTTAELFGKFDFYRYIGADNIKIEY
jgi:hypothetical protein